MSGVDVLQTLDTIADESAGENQHLLGTDLHAKLIEARAAVSELLESSADLARAVQEETDYLAGTAARALSGRELAVHDSRVMECTERLHTALARCGAQP